MYLRNKNMKTQCTHSKNDYVLKCSHTFNTLDANGAIGVSQRASFIGRVRDMAKAVSQLYVEQRKEMGYPLIKEGEK